MRRFLQIQTILKCFELKGEKWVAEIQEETMIAAYKLDYYKVKAETVFSGDTSQSKPKSLSELFTTNNLKIWRMP